MLKYEGMFAVGERVRAYDFEPREGLPENYIEGVVSRVLPAMNNETGFACYVVVPYKDSVFVKNSRVGEDVYVPFEVCFLEYENRIVKV